ncbi:TIGR03936 family radical SAM-associated protein [Sporohalobacter salinus]|uniref:TIGR03936 family radical SAM-associated protein n=1 Tax=Sporohalobacter salinus TaxID=1494606 RepID=UPI00195FC145|nr:TIGR03936 family radical SAM-associated protein [Sporohalobacter salinus]MBM7623105.1 radical SAM-linked protein [Sporohalobacter salinus]
MKIRAKMAKGDEVKFISHLDLMNTLTRALRRARIPIKFSQGYNPRPAISFGSALAVGIVSQCEYIDFELKTDFSVEKFKKDLNQELPTGIEILKAREIPVNTKSLMAKINAARYRIEMKTENIIDENEAKEMLADFLAKDEIMIVRKRRNKSDREFNLRPMVFELKLLDVMEKRIVIEALIQTGSSGNLRTEELVRAFQQRYPISNEFELTYVKRLGLYVKQKDKLLTPIEVALE